MAKGIEKIIQKFCVQTAVYWGNPQSDGYGGYTFDEPIEIACRWEDKGEVELIGLGEIRLSKSNIMVLQDLDEFGYLYLGTLDDFDSDVDTSDPRTITGARAIQRFDKIPMVFKTDEFVRTAWLYDQGK